MHAEHGIPLALNAGDALSVIGLDPLLDNPRVMGHVMAGRVATEFNHLLHHTAEGQSTELGWRHDNVVRLTAENYLDMVLQKTCAYTTIYPLRVGTLIGSNGSVQLDDVSPFGFHLGASFQIRDDLLNIEGQMDRYGKEILGDLIEGKRTLMLIHLMGRQLHRTDHEWLYDYLQKPLTARRESDAERILAMMRAEGSLDFAHQYGAGITAAVEQLFQPAFGRLPESVHTRFLSDLVSYVSDREV